MTDICILGGGPAGLSAGIYAARAGAETLILSKSGGALSLAKRIDNYFGVPSVSGDALLEIGRSQFLAFGGQFLEREVTAVEMIPNGFLLKTPFESVECRALILAVGSTKAGKKLPGEDGLLGRGVSHCAVCDGFFFRKKKVGVIGSGAYAAAEAEQLLAFTQDVTVFTNGETPSCAFPCPVVSDVLQEISGETKVSHLTFTNGEKFALDGVFIARGTAGASDLALKLGVQVKDGCILTDKNAMTNLPGVFAAGDCLGGFRQVSVAVGVGALAGQRAVEFIRKG